MLRRAPGQQAGQPHVHLPPGERVQKQVPAFAALQRFGQQHARRGQLRPALLQRQQRRHGLHLGPVDVAGVKRRQLAHHGIGQRVRQRHARAVPARQRGAAGRRAAHVGGHLLDADQRQQAAGKHEHVAGFQPRHEALFHRAELAAAQVLHGHRRIAHDGADVGAVAARQALIGHAPHAVVARRHALKVGVGGQRGPALAHKVEAPLPVLGRQVGIGRGAPHLGDQRIGHKTAAQRHRHQVLHQHIQRLARAVARFNLAGLHGGAGGGGLDQFQAVRGHHRDARRAPGRVAGSAGALQQPRHAARRADLQHALHWQKVHAQIQAAGGHHGFQAPLFQTQLHPFAHALVERAVVQRHHAGKVGPRLDQRLIPALGLRARVGEDQGRATALDRLDHLRQHLQAHVPGPGKALGARGQQGVDDQGFVDAALDQGGFGWCSLF